MPRFPRPSRPRAALPSRIAAAAAGMATGAEAAAALSPPGAAGAAVMGVFKYNFGACTLSLSLLRSKSEVDFGGWGI